MNQIINPNEWAAFHARHPGRFGKPARRKRHAPPPIIVPPGIQCVLAIDPSITACGWAIVEENGGKDFIRRNSGTWRPSESKDAGDRWYQFYLFVFGLAAGDFSDTEDPIFAAIEIPNFYGLARGKRFNQVDVATYGRAVGVAHAALMYWMQAVFTPDVESWKGRASKASTMLMVKARLGYEPKDDNEADALGLALWVLDRSADSEKGRV